MFNLRQFKLVKELKNKKPQMNWLKFSSSQNRNDEFLNSVIADNKFVQEDLKIRAMVEEMLVKEFSESIKDIESYDFLVDSVVNKLKKKQLGNTQALENIEL